MFRKECRKGQSILEYTLLLGVVIAIIAAILLGPKGMKDKIKGVYDKSGDAITNTTNDLTGGIFKP